MNAKTSAFCEGTPRYGVPSPLLTVMHQVTIQNWGKMDLFVILFPTVLQQYENTSSTDFLIRRQ